MAKLGYTFYPKDFISDPDVMFMSAAERGVYRDLIDLAYMNDNMIPYSIDMLAKYTNSDIETVERVLSKKGAENDGFFSIPSCEKRIDLINRNKENGSKGGRPNNPKKTQTITQSKTQTKPKQKADGNPNDNPNLTQNERQIEREIERENKKEIERKNEKEIDQNQSSIQPNDFDKIYPDQIVSVDTAIRLLKSERWRSWRERIGMQKSILPDKMFELFDIFENHLKDQNQFEKSAKDAQQHFSGWYEKVYLKSQTKNDEPKSESDPNTPPDNSGNWIWYNNKWFDKNRLAPSQLKRILDSIEKEK